MRIRSVRAYRRAISEIQRLENAREGEEGHARRHELLAAMHAFEQHYQDPGRSMLMCSDHRADFLQKRFDVS